MMITFTVPEENERTVTAMAEYIKREEAIAWFMPYVHAGESIEADVVISDLKGMKAADVAPVQEWISVKDRLPDAGGYVVCIAKRNPFSRFMPMVAIIKKNGWVNPITEQYISEVTHWMPIPEPPKGE